MFRVIVFSTFINMLVFLGFPLGLAQQTKFDNCKEMNRIYPHGVGKIGAKDKTKSGRPVTTFLFNTALYQKIVRQNGQLDRDNDGIACEKH